jgi:hypothetical protein
MLIYLFQFLILINVGQSSSTLSCKASLGSQDWPSPSAWAALNNSIRGSLLQPPPPGAVCHSDQVTYNAQICPAVQAAAAEDADDAIDDPLNNTALGLDVWVEGVNPTVEYVTLIVFSAS